METTVLTSSILWPILLLLWIGLFINTKYYKDIINHITNKNHTLVLAGILWMVVWSYMVSNHNVYESTPAIIISVIWWIALLKSALILALPESFSKVIKNMKYGKNTIKTVWILYIAIWLYLMNYAYFGV